MIYDIDKIIFNATFPWKFSSKENAPDFIIHYVTIILF